MIGVCAWLGGDGVSRRRYCSQLIAANVVCIMRVLQNVRNGQESHCNHRGITGCKTGVSKRVAGEAAYLREAVRLTTGGGRPKVSHVTFLVLIFSSKSSIFNY